MIAAPPIAVYLGLRAISFFVYVHLMHTLPADDPGAVAHLSWLDGGSYLNIAEHGYIKLPAPSDPRYPYTDSAFFPLYSLLIRYVAAATTLSQVHAGLMISFIAGLAAAVGIHRVVDRVRGRRVALLTVALWGIAPAAAYQSAVYADVLFVAFAAWTLYSLVQRNWLLAGVFCALGGFTRPTGTVLLATVGIAALVAVVKRQDGWRPWVGGAIAPLGLLAFVAWLWKDYGHWDSYFRIQKMWGTGFDWGRDTRLYFWGWMTDKTVLSDVTIVLAVITGAVILSVVLITERLPWQLTLFTLIGVFFCLGTYQYQTCKPRELMPFFPLLIPLAMALAKARTSTVVCVLVFLALFAGWYGWFIPVNGLTGPP